MFDAFFSKASMTGSYKPVLLDALVDAACCYGKEKSVKRGWIKFEDDKIHLKLDFIAARFALHYWEVYPFVFRHMGGGNSRKDRHDHDIRMVRLIGEHSRDRHYQVPDLDELQSSEMRELRHDIIQHALKPDVLGKLAKDLKGSYTYESGADHITLNADFVEYMKRNSKDLRDKIKAISY